VIAAGTDLLSAPISLCDEDLVIRGAADARVHATPTYIRRNRYLPAQRRR